MRMRTRGIAWTAGLVAACLALCGLPAAARCAEAAADSLPRFVWGAVYSARLDVVRSSAAFPWNEEESASHLADRLAAMGELRPRGGVSVFLKGASGRRLAGWGFENRFMLDQGHAAFALPGGAIEGRLFLRERQFRTNHRLMEIVSDESALLEGRAEGARIVARVIPRVRIEYIESAARDREAAETVGGLPLFHGGVDVFRLLRIEAAGGGRIRAGALLSEVRSIAAGDAVTVGVDIGAAARGIALVAELARSRRGRWDDLRDDSFFDLDFERFEPGAPSAVFSENDAFSAGIEGFSFRAGRFGSAGFVPAYRFVGASFANPQGELAPGTDEASVLAWWRPLKRDALLSIDASNGRRDTGEGRRLAAEARARCRGGLELSGRILAADGKRSSFVVSIASDARLARTSLVTRIDDAGDGNEVAFLARSSMRLTGTLTAGGALYLFGGGTTRYSVGLDLRPHERFLLTVAAGSFAPGFEEAAIRFGDEPLAPPEERSLVISGRYSLGGM